MKYQEVYAILNQRRDTVPGFSYQDYSGWRAPEQTPEARQYPLWIVASDNTTNKRFWILQEGSDLMVLIGKKDAGSDKYHKVKSFHYIPRAELACILRGILEDQKGEEPT